MGSTAGWSGRFVGAVGAPCVVVSALLLTPARAQAGGELVWTHTSGSQGWIGRVVSIGDRSSQVLTSIEGYSATTRLYSSFADDPADPAWQSTPAFFSFLRGVDSAERADAHVSLDFVEPMAGSQRRPVVSYFDSSSSSPQWNYTLPVSANSQGGGVHITANGQRIVAWVFDNMTNKTLVAVFGAGSPTPTASTLLTTLGEPLKVRMAANGSALYVASTLKTIVFDLNTNAVALDAMNWESIATGHAIAGDGAVIAKGLLSHRVEVQRRLNGVWSPWFTHDLGTTGACYEAALSEDGATMVVGSSFGTNGLTTRLQVLDLTQSTHPVVFEEFQSGSGAYTNNVSSLSMSARGDVIALGLTGDQGGLVPELIAYRRTNGAWSRTFSYDLPGSVNQVDLSADGTRLSVASKTTHLNVMSGGGRIDLFSLGTRDLWMEGTPRAGSTVVIKQRWAPGATGILLASPQPATTPQTFPGVGTLYLRRAMITTAGSGTTGTDGILSTTYTIPAGTAGTSINFQAWCSSPRSLSSDWLHIDVLP